MKIPNSAMTMKLIAMLGGRREERRTGGEVDERSDKRG